MIGWNGIAVEEGQFPATDPIGGWKGVAVEEGQGLSINPQLGTQGLAVEKIIRRLNSLAFGNLLPFVTNPRLDELRVTMPDGRVFELGSNLAYGTISVPFCFFDEADEGEIQITGYRRATWPNPIGERFEYFERMI